MDASTSALPVVNVRPPAVNASRALATSTPLSSSSYTSASACIESVSNASTGLAAPATEPRSGSPISVIVVPGGSWLVRKPEPARPRCIGYDQVATS